MAKQLLVIAGPDKGRVFPLSDAAPLLIGRSRDTETRLNDPHVSRVHCEVEIKGQEVLVTDLDSGGGTFLNGQRVAQHPLQFGDIISVGETQLCYKGEDIAEQATLLPENPAATKIPFGVPPLPAPAAPAAATQDLPALAPKRPGRLPAERLQELSGTTLSHFEIGPLLARGKTGLVFKARDFKDERVVAFKVFWPDFARNEEEVQRFVRAMKTMLPLRHPHLVSVHGAGKTSGYCWISMEYVEGESLTQVIQRIGTAGMLDWRHAFRVAVHVGKALQFAHGQHIVHRNIRPSNILVQSDNQQTKLGDLMLAKAMEGTNAEQITRPGELLGDIRFMAPEQTGGTRTPDERSDIFSLGATVYTLLTGQPPFDGSSLVDIIQKIRQVEPAKPKKYQLSVPDMFEGIVLKMLAKRPDERYQSAADLLAALGRVARYQGGKA